MSDSCNEQRFCGGSGNSGLSSDLNKVFIEPECSHAPNFKCASADGGSLNECLDVYNATDEEIIEIARNTTDNEAMCLNSVIISRYIRTIELKARQLKNSMLEEEDLISEGFLGFLSALRTYCHGKGLFKSYAGVCISNKMKSAIMAAVNTPFRADDFDFHKLADKMPHTEEIIIEKEKETEIRKMLTTLLSKKEMQVFTLYINAYSYKQISQKLGISIKSVDNSLSRARLKLREGYIKL